MKKKFVIIGGGTAGWLSALYVNKLYGTDADITLIESDEIGILGAGEGTVPLFVYILKYLDIDVYHFMIECNATHKIGISFENWNGDGERYMHDFQKSYFNETKDEATKIQGEYMGYLIDKGLNPLDYSVSKQLAYSNKSPILKNGDEPCGYSFHFDAHLVAQYFRKLAEERGVKRVEGKTKNFIVDQSGNLTSVLMETGYRYQADFWFDCSGFKRLIVGQLYKTPWISYKDKLTVNSAIPFFLPQSETELKPYTRAIAMKYGWMWQIPLQNRWGCGYIFDDNYIDYEKAKQEVEEHLGHSIEINKLIKFRAGRFLNTWVNNVIAIGLSSGFTEPLEATSIMVAIAGLKDLSKTVLDNYNERVIKEYNDFMGSYNDEIVDFLQFHYITKRTDTPFWKYYTEKSPLSDSLRNIVESYFNGKFFTIDEKDKIVFAESNYMEVGYGLEFFDSDYFKQIYQQYKDKGVVEKIHQHNSQSLKYTYDNSMPALAFLKLVKIAYDDNQLDDFKKLLKKDEPKEKEKSSSWKLW